MVRVKVLWQCCRKKSKENKTLRLKATSWLPLVVALAHPNVLCLFYFFILSHQGFFRKRKTSNLEAYVNWFNRLSYLVATEICTVAS